MDIFNYWALFFFFAHILVHIVYLIIITLSYTNFIVSRNNYKRKTSLPVDVRSETPNINDNVNDDTILVSIHSFFVLMYVLFKFYQELLVLHLFIPFFSQPWQFAC